MIEVLIFVAASILIWMTWRLYQAKQYNRFIDWLNGEIKTELIANIESELIANRCAKTPNQQEHIEAALWYYQQYPVRIFEAAIQREIIPGNWLDNKANKRHAAHLLFTQANFRLKR